MAKPMDQYKWHELNLGCVIEDVGNAQEYKTGDWRSQKPFMITQSALDVPFAGSFALTQLSLKLRMNTSIPTWITAKVVASVQKSARLMPSPW